MSSTTCKYRVGYALNPKKLRKSEKIENVNDDQSSKGKPSKLWRGGGLADILECQTSDEDSESIIFQPWDYRIAPENQPQFDLIIHKLTEDLTRETEESREKLASLEKFLQYSPNTVIVDPIECVEKVTSRACTVDSLATIQHRLGRDCPFRQPNYLVLNEPTTPEEVLRRMDAQQMHFPVIGKPIEACGKPHSHQMVVIVSAEELGLLMFPSVLQQYHNHAQRLFKVYVIAQEVVVALRPSLPDLPAQELSRGAYHSVAFDSRYCYPTRTQFLRQSNNLNTASSSSSGPTHSNNSHHSSNNGDSDSDKVIAEYAEVFRATAQVIGKHFGLTLFGFDVILACPHDDTDTVSDQHNDASSILVIDINFFPSYKEVPDFPARLRSYLRHRIASHKNINNTNINENNQNSSSHNNNSINKYSSHNSYNSNDADDADEIVAVMC